MFEGKREEGGFSFLPRSGPKPRIQSEKEFSHEDQKMRPRGTLVCCYEQRSHLRQILEGGQAKKQNRKTYLSLTIKDMVPKSMSSSIRIVSGTLTDLIVFSTLLMQSYVITIKVANDQQEDQFVMSWMRLVTGLYIPIFIVIVFINANHEKSFQLNHDHHIPWVGRRWGMEFLPVLSCHGTPEIHIY